MAARSQKNVKFSEVETEVHETRDPTTSESEDSSCDEKENQLEDQDNSSPDVSFHSLNYGIQQFSEGWKDQQTGSC